MAIKKIKKSKYKLSPSESKKCHKIIHASSGSAGAVGAGLAQLPLADNAVITPIQIGMIISLGKVFDQEITKTVAKSLLASSIASFVGRGVAQAAWGWIPGIGNVNNAITATVITESIGWLSVDHFYKKKYLEVKKSTPKTPVKEKTVEDESKRVVLKKQAEQFLNGEKSIKNNLSEYHRLLNDFAEYLSNVEEEMDELYEYHYRLIALL